MFRYNLIYNQWASCEGIKILFHRGVEIINVWTGWNELACYLKVASTLDKNVIIVILQYRKT